VKISTIANTIATANSASVKRSFHISVFFGQKDRGVAAVSLGDDPQIAPLVGLGAHAVG
jgi:hypothetical protein